MRPIDFFDTAVEMYADRVAIVDDGVTLTFDRLAAMSKRLATFIQDVLGGPHPLPVGVWSPNAWQEVAATVAIMRAGGIVMPIHAGSSAPKVADYLNQIEPQLMFFHSSLVARAAEVRKRVSNHIRWICLDSDGAGSESLERLTERLDEYIDAWGDAYGNPDRPAFVRQTSGTTGEPKALVGNVVSFAVSHIALRYCLASAEQPVALVATPFSHAAGLHAFGVLTLGGRLVLLPDFDVVQVLRSIEAHAVTHMWLPSSALNLMLSHPSVRKFDCSSLRQVLIGASAPSPEKLREAIEVFGPCIAVHYGQSEGGFLTWLDETTLGAAAVGCHPERLASSGTTMHVGRLAILDERGSQLPRGEVGEIVVRGASVKPFIRRIGEHDVGEMAISKQYGWHHTGDLGYIDAAGYLFVVGRKKDMVITSGFKVASAEVERVVLELPEVAECAVIGVPDELRGEAVKAVVTVRDGHSLNPATILAHCRSRLGGMNTPMSVEQWAELPKTAVGKVDKVQIRQRFWTGSVRDVN